MSIASHGAMAAEAQTPRALRVAAQGEQFSTIQSAVNAARPGDTVLVHGGVYREAITFPIPGEPGKPITIRAVPQQIVMITTSSLLKGQPESVPGNPHVYRWIGFELDGTVDKMGIWEASSHLRLKRVSSLDQCERRLASWFYDTQAKALYVRSSSAVPAKDLVYVIEDALRPVFDIRQPHIVLDGLQMAFGAHGVLIHLGAHHVTVRNCRAFCHRSAGIHMSGNYNVLEDNELFRNNYHGIQLRSGVTYSRIAGNLAYYNGPNNGETIDGPLPTDIGMYSKGGYNVFENNVIDGLHQYAFRNKYGSNNTVVCRNNVVRGFFYFQSPCIRNNTVIVNNVGVRFGQYINRLDTSVIGNIDNVDPSGAQRRTNIIYPAVDKEEPRFADLAYRDYRLQSDSPYRGKGAFPGETPVMFVDPAEGSDENDGRSIASAFKSPARAMKTVHPGDTIYLLPGVYKEPLEISVGGLTEKEPLRIRAYGRSSDVVLEGGIVFRARVNWSLENVPLAHISLEGLTVHKGAVKIADCSDVRLSYCVLADQETALELSKCVGVRLDHVTIQTAKTGVDIADCRNISITNSLFVDVETSIACNAASLPELYADYNAYTALRNRLSQRIVKDMDEWKVAIAGGNASSVVPVALDKNHALPIGSTLTFAASDYTFVGARPVTAAARLEITDLRAGMLSPESATLLWQTAGGATESRVTVQSLKNKASQTVQPVTTFQIMGRVFDMTFRTSAFFTAQRHATIRDLEPGRDYEATVTVRNVEGTATNSAKIRFTTPTAMPPPRTFYVSTQGDDDAEGTTRELAWRTFDRAAGTAGPGDRVIVLPGVYNETLRPRTSGTKSHPILYESAGPRGATIELMGSMAAGIDVMNVDYVHVKGFKLHGGGYGHNIIVANARGVRISGCHVTYPEGMSFTRMRAGRGGLVAVNAPDLTVDNNVFLCGYVGVGVSICPGAKIFNNTILGEGNYGIVLVPGEQNETYVVKNNIFYQPVMGYKTNPALWVMNAKANLMSDNNLYYIPPKVKGTIGKLPDTNRTRELVDWQRATGLDRQSVVGQPIFTDAEKGDFRLKAGSIGLDAADDGGPVGARME